MITKIKLDLYVIIYHAANFEWNQCIPSRVIGGKQYLYLVFLTPTTKPKLKKGHNFAKILQMATNTEPDLYFTMIYPSANFQ